MEKDKGKEDGLKYWLREQYCFMKTILLHVGAPD